MQSDRVRGAYHPMDSHLFMNAGQVFLANVCNFDDLARVDLLRRVDCWPYSLLLRSVFIYILQQIRCELRLANFPVLAFTEHVIHEDNEIVDFAHLRLLGSRLCAPASPSSWVVALLPLRSTTACRTVIDWNSLSPSRLNARLFWLYHYCISCYLLILIH